MSLVSIIRKAKRLQNSVNFDGTGRTRYYFVVDCDGKEVRLIIETNEMTKLKKCDCKHHSIKDPQCNSLCSYYLACLFHLKEKLK